MTGPRIGALPGAALPAHRREVSAAGAERAAPTTAAASAPLTYAPSTPRVAATGGVFRGQYVDVRV